MFVRALSVIAGIRAGTLLRSVQPAGRADAAEQGAQRLFVLEQRLILLVILQGAKRHVVLGQAHLAVCDEQFIAPALEGGEVLQQLPQSGVISLRGGSEGGQIQSIGSAVTVARQP